MKIRSARFSRSQLNADLAPGYTPGNISCVSTGAPSMFTGPGSALFSGMDRTAAIDPGQLVGGFSAPISAWHSTSGPNCSLETPDFVRLRDKAQVNQMLGEMASFSIDNNVYNLSVDENPMTGATQLWGFYAGTSGDTNINPYSPAGLPKDPVLPYGNWAVAGIEFILRIQALQFMPLFAQLCMHDAIVPTTTDGATAVFGPRTSNSSMLQRGFAGSGVISTSTAPYVLPTQPLVMAIKGTYASFFVPFAKANLLGVEPTVGLARAGRLLNPTLGYNSFFNPIAATAEAKAVAQGVKSGSQYFNFMLDVGVLPAGTTVAGNFKVATAQSQATGYLGLL